MNVFRQLTESIDVGDFARELGTDNRAKKRPEEFDPFRRMNDVERFQILLVSKCKPSSPLEHVVLFGSYFRSILT